MLFSGTKFYRNPVFLSAGLLLCCMAGSLSGQLPVAARSGRPETNNVMGYVRDSETNEALPYANVLISGTNYGAATNADGYFVIVNAPADTCRLKVLYVGYNSQEIALDNTRPLMKPLLIKMVRQTIEMQEITVTQPAEMLEVSDDAGQVAISPAEVAILPNVGEVDIFRSLQLLPGISGVNDGSSGLYVRGGTPDQNLILLDGMTVYHVDHFFGMFSAFNADAIKDIRVYKGGFPAEFGGRTSSVVNLTGKTGDVNNLRYGMGMNLLSAHGVVEVPLSEKVNFLLSARRSYTDLVQSSLYNKLFDFMSGASASGESGPGNIGNGSAVSPNISMRTQNPDFYFYDLNSKITYNPSPLDILSLSIYSGRDNLGQFQNLSGTQFDYRGVDLLFDDPNASLKTSQNTRWGNLGLSGKWSRKINDRVYANLLATYSEYVSKYDLSRSFSSSSGLDSLHYFRGTALAGLEDNRLRDLSLHLDNEIHLANSHDLKVGLGLTDFDVRYTSSQNDTTYLVRRETSAMLGSWYLQDLWKLSPAFEVTGGLRGTYYQETAAYYSEPRASLIYKLSNSVRLKSAWGRYYQFVNRIANENILDGSRDFWVLSDKELEPGYAEHWLAGITTEDEEFLLDVEGYYKDLDKVVQYSRRASYQQAILLSEPGSEALLRGSGFFQGTGFAKGIDVLLQRKTGRLTGWVGYSYGKVHYKFPDLNDGRPFPAAHDRTHEVSVVGKLALKRWDVTATWVYATGKAYTVPENQYYLHFKDGSNRGYIHVSEMNSYRLPEYQRLDFSVSRNFETRTNKYVMGFSIFNVLNHTNLWYRQFDLNTVPVAVTDVKMLNFTPTVYFQVYSR